MSVGIYVVGIIWFILEIIAYWKIFTKAGRPGWKSIIPFLNSYEVYDLSWKGKGPLGLFYSIVMCAIQLMDRFIPGPIPQWVVTVFGATGIVLLVMSFMQCLRLAKCFGKGTGFGIGLVFLAPIFKLILGFGGSKYIGAQD